jgi:hypothetical protein
MRVIIADSLFQCVFAGLIIKTKQTKNEDSFSDALNYNHILKEYMKRREDKMKNNENYIQIELVVYG